MVEPGFKTPFKNRLEHQFMCKGPSGPLKQVYVGSVLPPTTQLMEYCELTLFCCDDFNFAYFIDHTKLKIKPK